MRSRVLVCMIRLVFGLAIISYYGCDTSSPIDSGPSEAGPSTPSFRVANPLLASDVRTIITQAVTEAIDQQAMVTVVVTDRAAKVLGAFRMTGAPTHTMIDREAGMRNEGLELFEVPAELAALSKAGTAASFATSGNAFTTRTASDIIQEHRPRTIRFTPSGPLFGVQFSSLACSDIKIDGALPLGLAGDPGGVPLYKNGEPVGAIGVEGDGNYGIDRDPFDGDQPIEERIAVAGSRGFEAPANIRGDTILLDGIRLPFVNVEMPPPPPALAFEDLPGQEIEVGIPADSQFFFDRVIRDTPDAAFGFADAALDGVPGRIAVDAQGRNRFPFRDSASREGLTAQEVERIISQAIEQAVVTRAAIRQPRGSFAQVNVAVVDADGVVLGYFSTPDAPFFGFDVSVQKARTSAFFSSSRAGSELLNAGLEAFVNAALADGLALDGSVAFSDRGAGFLNRPLLPDGIDGTAHGPFSRPISQWSPFNVGLQLELIFDTLGVLLFSENVDDVLARLGDCARIAGLENGIQIFAGSVPLFKKGA
ncbi:MAG: hypothetical protein ETSY2_23925, partial [Candidatus Entotheonella gemina]